MEGLSRKVSAKYVRVLLNYLKERVGAFGESPEGEISNIALYEKALR